MTLSVFTVQACSVPVFRYALERWAASPYEAIVFHRGPLTRSNLTVISQLSSDVFTNTSAANISVQAVDLAAETVPEMLALWKNHQNASLPFVVVRYPQGAAAQGEVWSGPLETNAISSLLDSPVRQRIAQRLLKGDCGVWLLLESGDKTRDDAAANLLQTRLTHLEKNIQLPKLEAEDIANRVISVAETELKVAFSCMRLARNAASEQVFIRMLLASEEDLRDQKEPIAFLITGRGRALLALVGKGINEETIDEACTFLTGPCSCVVKEQNPGVDLLMAVDWDSAIQPQSPVIEPPPPLTGLTALAQTSQLSGVTGLVATRTNLAPTQALNVRTNSSAPLQQGPAFVRPLLFAGAAGLLILVAGTLWLSRRRE